MAIRKVFTSRNDTMNKFYSVLVAAIILGAASIAFAATSSKYDAAARSGTATAESFQNNWNVGY
jgi:hypothetical protein